MACEARSNAVAERGAARAALVGRLAALLLSAALPACESVPLMAPVGSTVLLQANPGFVPANGGRSVVTAVLTEPQGTFVPDGTVVYFFTDLGQIEASAKTVDGLARVYFVADARSGQACVMAYSGGTSAACQAGTGASSGAASGQGSASVTISVGSALPTTLILTADPPDVVSPGHSTITANVYDANGNPVQHVPVLFTIEASATLTETLDSGGAPRFTDSSGQAFDLLRTRAPLLVPKTVTVQAWLPNASAAAGQVVVDIN